MQKMDVSCKKWKHDNLIFASQTEMMPPSRVTGEITGRIAVTMTDTNAPLSPAVNFYLDKTPGNCGALFLFGIGTSSPGAIAKETMTNVLAFVKEFAKFHNYTCVFYTTILTQEHAIYLKELKWKSVPNIFKNKRTRRDITFWYILVDDMNTFPEKVTAEVEREEVEKEEVKVKDTPVRCDCIICRNNRDLNTIQANGLRT